MGRSLRARSGEKRLIKQASHTMYERVQIGVSPQISANPQIISWLICGNTRPGLRARDVSQHGAGRTCCTLRVVHAFGTPRLSRAKGGLSHGCCILQHPCSKDQHRALPERVGQRHVRPRLRLQNENSLACYRAKSRSRGLRASCIDVGMPLALIKGTAAHPVRFFNPIAIHLHTRRHAMQWTTPSYTDLRFGFEITMYIANR